MALAFRIRPDEAGWSKRNAIEATHLRTFPGVRCPSCGTWTRIGCIYPTAEIAVLDQLAELTSPWPVPLEQYRLLKEKIQPVLGVHRPLSPGASLGPLRGVATGTFGDFAWVNPWTPLVRESVWSTLKEQGIQLMGVPAELKSRKKSFEVLIEIEALPKVELLKNSFPTPCGMCSRIGMKVPDKIVLDAKSFDASIPLQRIVQMPNSLVANEQLAEFIRSHALRDVLLIPLELE